MKTWGFIMEGFWFLMLHGFYPLSSLTHLPLPLAYHWMDEMVNNVFQKRQPLGERSCHPSFRSFFENKRKAEEEMKWSIHSDASFIWVNLKEEVSCGHLLLDVRFASSRGMVELWWPKMWRNKNAKLTPTHSFSFFLQPHVLTPMKKTFVPCPQDF